jgi:hypothetical protein
MTTQGAMCPASEIFQKIPRANAPQTKNLAPAGEAAAGKLSGFKKPVFFRRDTAYQSNTRAGFCGPRILVAHSVSCPPVGLVSVAHLMTFSEM